ncbi:hypothetical protein CONLIGDRAFT_644578 [Coniochaeta ligniaria NRRL 30616]|uniref:Uncharacterized protein n=1 Tax=Coniochaeta ligniaria NRRL 30616 TaxID=1408157 RepID=A0A1J7IMA7_9PEZI|nr:hypothetical protein CONLIGDRAFT_644578 [Coniochaeta ligniaria NRRL 30616]
MCSPSEWPRTSSAGRSPRSLPPTSGYSTRAAPNISPYSVRFLEAELSMMGLSEGGDKRRVPKPRASSVDSAVMLEEPMEDTTMSSGSFSRQLEEGGTASSSPNMHSDEGGYMIGHVILKKLESSGEALAKFALICLVLGARVWPTLTEAMAERMAAYERFRCDLREAYDHYYVVMRGGRDPDPGAQEFHEGVKAVIRKVMDSDLQLRGDLAEWKSTLGRQDDDGRREMEYIIFIIDELLKEYGGRNE